MQPINDIVYEDSVCFTFVGIFAILFNYCICPLIMQATWNQVVPDVFLGRILPITYYHAFLLRILVSFWVTGFSYAWVHKRDDCASLW